MSAYKIDSVFFTDYTYLTPKAWQVLLLFYILYQDHQVPKINMNRSVFYTKLNLEEYRSQPVWNELRKHDLVTQTKVAFKLKLKNPKITFKIITGQRISKSISITEYMMNKLNDLNISARLKKKFIITFKGYRMSVERLKDNFSKRDTDVFFHMIDTNDPMAIEDTFDIYNSTERYWGSAGINLIRAILLNENKKIQKKDKRKKVKQEHEENIEEEFCIELVTGQVKEDDVVYDYLVRNAEYDILRNYYDRGKNIIKAQNITLPIKGDYSWLEK